MGGKRGERREVGNTFTVQEALVDVTFNVDKAAANVTSTADEATDTGMFTVDEALVDVMFIANEVVVDVTSTVDDALISGQKGRADRCRKTDGGDEGEGLCCGPRWGHLESRRRRRTGIP